MIVHETGQRVSGSHRHADPMDDTTTTTSTTTPMTSRAAAEASGHPAGGAGSGEDPRQLLRRAMDLGGRVVAEVRPEQMELPTPCGDLDVRALLAHTVSVLDRVAVIGRGGDVFSVPRTAPVVADDEWPGRWRDAAQEVVDAWADDDQLRRTYQLPWTLADGAAAVAVYTNELTVHTWDLAHATGQHPAWDPAVVDASLRAIHEQLPDAERQATWAAFSAQLPPGAVFEPPFADAVDVPGDAPAIERLVAWNGRRP
jgi:uncharacterized protein (TIGR03086 family)